MAGKQPEQPHPVWEEDALDPLSEDELERLLLDQLAYHNQGPRPNAAHYQNMQNFVRANLALYLPFKDS